MGQEPRPPEPQEFFAAIVREAAANLELIAEARKKGPATQDLRGVIPEEAPPPDDVPDEFGDEGDPFEENDQVSAEQSLPAVPMELSAYARTLIQGSDDYSTTFLEGAGEALLPDENSSPPVRDSNAGPVFGSDTHLYLSPSGAGPQREASRAGRGDG